MVKNWMVSVINRAQYIQFPTHTSFHPHLIPLTPHPNHNSPHPHLISPIPHTTQKPHPSHTSSLPHLIPPTPHPTHTLSHLHLIPLTPHPYVLFVYHRCIIYLDVILEQVPLPVY